MDNRNLEILIKRYETKNSQELDRKLTHFQGLSTVEDIVCKAAMAIDPNNQKESHQRRLKKSVLKRTTERLLNCKEGLLKANSFKDIMRIVEESRVSGFGELAVYDTALKIGAWRGLSPTLVYLHAGTRKGARALELRTAKGFLQIDELPEPMRNMEPHHIENFLCIYKGDFKDALSNRIAGCANSYGKASKLTNGC